MQETGAAMSKHKTISFIKSGVRIAACLLGIHAFWGHFFAMHAFAFLFIAEILGVVEERYETPAGESFKTFAAHNTRTMCTAEATGQGVWAGSLHNWGWDKNPEKK
jgi:hypothetical protein